MNFLLDTNVVSEMRKSSTVRNARLHAWTGQRPTESLFISVLTVQEIETGIGRLERRDPAQAGVFRHWLSAQLIPSFRHRIKPVDVAVATQAGQLHVPDKRPVVDALIAATAQVHGLIMVTRNVRDFEAMGVPVLNPFED